MSEALRESDGDIPAAAAKLGQSPARVYKRIVHEAARFESVQPAITRWVARHTAARETADLAKGNRGREELVGGLSPRAAQTRDRAMAAERRAISHAEPQAKRGAWEEATRHWLSAASLEDPIARHRPHGASANALRAIDSLRACGGCAPGSPWPAVEAALRGELDACAGRLPAAVPPAAGAQLDTARAAAQLDALSRRLAALAPGGDKATRKALIADIEDALEAHPHHATDFAALAVEACAHAGLWRRGAKSVRKRLKWAGVLIHRAVALEGQGSAWRGALLEADAHRLAGHPARARAVLHEAAGVAHSASARTQVALARVRLECAAGRPARALAALEALGTAQPPAASAEPTLWGEPTERGDAPEQRALHALIAAQLGWMALANPQFSPEPPASTAPPERSLRHRAQARGAAQPPAAPKTPARASKAGRNRRTTAADARRTSIQRLQQGLVAARLRLTEAYGGSGRLPPDAQCLLRLLDDARRRLRAFERDPERRSRGASPGLGFDLDRALCWLRSGDLLAHAGISLERALDPRQAPVAPAVGGLLGTFTAWAAQPESLPLAPAAAGPTGPRPDRAAPPPPLAGALATCLRTHGGPPTDDETKRRDRALGHTVALALAGSSSRAAGPTSHAGPLEPANGTAAAQWRTAWTPVARELLAAVGGIAPTEGPQSRAELEARLAALGFFEAEDGIFRYEGLAEKYQDLVLSLAERHFAGVGDDVWGAELTIGRKAPEELRAQDDWVPLDTQVHIGALVFDASRWARVHEGYEDTLNRAARALRTGQGASFRPSDLAEVRTLISMGRGEEVGGASRLERVRDLMELRRLARRISDKAGDLRASGMLEGFQLEIGEENAAGKTTIGQLALEALGDAGFSTRSYSPKAPSEAEKKQHPIQRHIDHGPQPGEAVFSDRTMAGSYAYNRGADDAYLTDMARRRARWDESLFDEGIAQASLQVNPGRDLSGDAAPDYAQQTAYVMGKREARAAVARHLLSTLGARGQLDEDTQRGLQDASRAGPGYRDYESLHTGEDAARRAEDFARAVSNPHNEWAFVGSLERHPSRVRILETVLEKLNAFEARVRARARAQLTLFSSGRAAEALPEPTDEEARVPWRELVDEISGLGPRSDALEAQLNGIAAQKDASGRVELVLRRKPDLGEAERLPRRQLIALAREALAERGAPPCRITVVDARWA